MTWAAAGPKALAATGIVMVAILVAAGIAVANHATHAPTAHIAAPSTSTSVTTAGNGATTSVSADTTATTVPVTKATTLTPAVSPPPPPPPPQTCTNADLGYSLTLPTGWQTGTPTTILSACQLFSTKAFDPVAATANPLLAPVEFGSLASTPAVLTAGETNLRAVAVAGLQATAVDASLVDPLVPTGTRSYTYYIDRGRSTLVALLMTPPGTTAAERATDEKALDAMVASLHFQTPACHNSTAPPCGDFYWNLDPAPNQPISLTDPIIVTPAQPTVGATVTITVTVTDPDADSLTDIQACYGDPSVCGLTSPETTECSILCQLQQSATGPVHGPWTPPPIESGSKTFTFQHVYKAVGRYHFQTEVRSANGSAPPGHDPYSSDAIFDTFVTVN